MSIYPLPWLIPVTTIVGNQAILTPPQPPLRYAFRMPLSAKDTSEKNAQRNWYVYIVQCEDNTLYTGITRNPERREKQHNGLLSGGARYTRSRRPVRMVFNERVGSRSDAAQREYRIKKMSRAAKEDLIDDSFQRSTGTRLGHLPRNDPRESAV